MRIRTLFAAALGIAVGVVGVPGLSTPAATAYPTANVEFEGHGWGHGRGMGQYGAYGYAQQGWNADQILNHYYSNTTNGTLPGGDGTIIQVRLTKFDAPGDIIVTNADTQVAGQPAFLIRRVGANSFDVYTGAGCGGPTWTKKGANPKAGPLFVPPAAGQNITVCDAAGNRPYRGTLTVYESNGSRVYNETTMHNYLAALAEMPASWPAAAQQAQMVAGRSYASAAGFGSTPDICDSTACQVYGGVNAESANRTAAVTATAGRVRMLNGAIARTEYSSSTGGQTAGGVFPSVPDAGDAIAANPNHNWTASIPVGTVQSKYPSIGTLSSVRVTERTPADGGLRAKTVVLSGSSGSVTVTGDDLRRALGLKSTWFSIINSPSGGINGYWVLGADGGVFTFGQAGYYGSTGGWKLNAPVISMAATKSGKGYWLLSSDGGIFSFGDAAQHFYGSTGGWKLNAPVVGMARTPSGNGYWVVARDGGIFSFGDAAGKFYGSTGGWKLNAPIVGMVATSTGNGYWLVASDGGLFAFGDAAKHFYGSMGGTRLARPVIGMAARADDSGYWEIGADGGLFAFHAPFYGSLPSRGISATAVGMRPTATGQGYLIAASDGNVYSFGDAPIMGGVPDAIPGWQGRAIGLEVSRG